MVGEETTNEKFNFSLKEIDRIIEMAWEDRTPFEAIEFQFGLKEKEVIEFMRLNSLPSSFRMWRKRMKARKTKHSFLRTNEVGRFKCTLQKSTGNKISKR
ncbi:MAG: TIGR03643 family protein [Solirubrobacteraceae bacterium]